MSLHHFRVIGRVQGIGYRRWATDIATQMGLSGWVRNMSDGSVEIMVQGDQETINQFLQKCLKGPAFAKVLGIQPVVVSQNSTPPVETGIFRPVASA